MSNYSFKCPHKSDIKHLCFTVSVLPLHMQDTCSEGLLSFLITSSCLSFYTTSLRIIKSLSISRHTTTVCDRPFDGFVVLRKCNYYCQYIHYLYSLDASADNLSVVVLSAEWTGMLTLPQKVESTTITRPLWTVTVEENKVKGDYYKLHLVKMIFK